jgi:dienelactone hydrolase
MRSSGNTGSRGELRALVLLCGLAGCATEENPTPAEHPAPTVLLERRAEEISFASTDLTLEGTLLIPARPRGEALPAIILGHGSGPIDRDETVDGQLGMGFGFEIPAFGELAEALADAGYVVLRYDKRSCTVRTGCQNSYPLLSGSGAVDDYVADLKAGLDWLLTREEVDGERLFYVGHSQGGQFAPELLASRSDLKAGVMLAGPHASVDALVAYQAGFLRQLVTSLGGTADDPTLLALDQGVLQLAQLRAGTFTGSSIMGAPVLEWQSWMELGDRARPLVPQLARPLLALSGDYDWNVPPSETDAWRESFAAVPSNPGHEAVLLPCVSHVLNCISQPDVTLLSEADFGRHVDPAVPAEIVRFLALHGGAR